MTEKRRLAFVLKSSDLGGVQKYVLELCRRLDRSVYQIEVVASPGGPLIETLEQMGIAVQIVDIPRYKISAWADFRATMKLIRLFKERKYHIVHPQNSKPGAMGRFAAWRAKVPIIIFTYHGVPFHDHIAAWKRWIYCAVDRWLARHCTTKLIGVAHHVKETIVRRRVAPPELVEVVWNGLDEPERPPTEEERAQAKRDLGVTDDLPTVAFIARMMPQKNPESYVRAVAECHRRGVKAQYLLIGDGKLRAPCEALAKSLGLTEDKLRFLGERKNIPKLLPGVDVYVLPSLWEGLPFALLEAMQAAVPIVCGDTPGNDEVVIDGESGRRVPPLDAEKMAEAIAELIEKPDWARQMGMAGYERQREHFTFKNMVAQTSEIYDKLWQERMGRS